MTDHAARPISLRIQPGSPDAARPDEERWAGYNLLILFCCIMALGLLATGDMGRTDPQVRWLLDWADKASCGVFVIAFVVRLVRAE